MDCLVCQHAETIEKHLLYDDRYGHKGLFELLQCKNCEHQFLKTAPKINELGDLYTDFYPRKSFNPDNFRAYKAGGKLYNWLVGGRASACQSVEPNSKVLDIGCGYGETLAYLQNEKSCDVYGVDADRNVEIIAEKYGFKIHVGIFDSSLYASNFFDFVTMNQVIEHVPDIHETFNMISEVLKPGGRCVLSTPNANGWGSRLFRKKWLNWHTPYHQHFLSIDSVHLLGERYGFTVESIETITRSEWFMYQLLHVIHYPKQGVPSAFWASFAVKSTRSKKFLQRVILATWFLCIPQLITRLFDSIGIGDNYLIILKKKQL
ncbi:MAG: hypothetical protein CL578_01110 [Alteromonadaceae bacterium]|jgi:methionine biosynthesis protein MetW|uniref:class I SAM-dependent methyltransferase n=1 Tax=unclassified Methylophaga TaxID=2629249 RepID=UPI000C56F4C9|nr:MULTISPECIES: class I SAM-dependent methyltransferase [unclassified Methylophaga]MAP27035.1 hypothetical protein [Methylophaga sp.]MBN23634.1 hypothetical protein [Alteromonadaceae bacterium]HCO01215.1 hypothetical protein [Methylophaga sp.]|tara:strand:- start:6309 stop:7265 length:957 start_codon:yes stop_codon:yes gene_type:complete